MESNVQLLWTEEEVRQARDAARKDFLARLEKRGLTVPWTVQEKWWGIKSNHVEDCGHFSCMNSVCSVN